VCWGASEVANKRAQHAMTSLSVASAATNNATPSLARVNSTGSALAFIVTGLVACRRGRTDRWLKADLLRTVEAFTVAIAAEDLRQAVELK
jgi:hypothetical protein